MRNRRYRPSVLLASGMLAVSGGAAAQNAPGTPVSMITFAVGSAPASPIREMNSRSMA